MASAAVFDGLTALRRVDPRAAALGEALAALLADAGFTAAVVAEPGEALWFATAERVHVRMLRRDGAPIPLHEDRVGDAVALLDAADWILARIEAVLGIALEPENLVRTAPGEGVTLSFEDAGWSGLLAVPFDHSGRGDWELRARAPAPAPALMPTVVAVAVHGPRLAIAEAGALAPGDLVLVAARPAATLELGGAAALTGQLDLATGNFTVQPNGAPMTEPPADFAVPLTLRLPDRMTSAASLAALAPGTTLPLGPLTDGIAVELLVAGRPLARGELVQLGDRFAVLIEERNALDDVTPAEAVAAEEAGA